MREINLRWSPSRGFLVLPGDESKAEPFHISGERLIDAELFRGASLKHNWPALPFVAWRKKIILELCEIGIPEDLPVHRRADVRMTVNNLLDARITLEECVEQLAAI